MPDPQPAWAQQYNADMQPVWSRQFEPTAISGRESQAAMWALLKLTAATVVAAATGVPARTVSRILARHGRPPIAALDPVTGIVVRASRTTPNRYPVSGSSMSKPMRAASASSAMSSPTVVTL